MADAMVPLDMVPVWNDGKVHVHDEFSLGTVTQMPLNMKYHRQDLQQVALRIGDPNTGRSRGTDRGRHSL